MRIQCWREASASAASHCNGPAPASVRAWFTICTICQDSGGIVAGFAFSEPVSPKRIVATSVKLTSNGDRLFVGKKRVLSSKESMFVSIGIFVFGSIPQNRRVHEAIPCRQYQ